MKRGEKLSSRGRSLCKSLNVVGSSVGSRGLEEVTGRWHQLTQGGGQAPFLQGPVSRIKDFLFYLKYHWRFIRACEMAWFLFLKDFFSDHVMKAYRRIREESARMNELTLVKCLSFAQWHTSYWSFHSGILEAIYWVQIRCKHCARHVTDIISNPHNSCTRWGCPLAPHNPPLGCRGIWNLHLIVDETIW